MGFIILFYFDLLFARLEDASFQKGGRCEEPESSGNLAGKFSLLADTSSTRRRPVVDLFAHLPVTRPGSVTLTLRLS